MNAVPMSGISWRGTTLATPARVPRIVRRASLIPALAVMFVTQIGVVTAQEPEADLGVTLSAGSGSAGVGVLVRYFNAGPSDATDTVITIDVPDAWWLAEGPAFCQEGTGAVTCVIGTYRAPAADFFQLRFMPSAPGEATIRATITSTTPDPNPANNQAEATVTVANEADLSVSLSRGTGTI